MARDHFEKIDPYFAKSSGESTEGFVRLHIGESPFGPTPSLYNLLTNDIQSISLYPDPSYRELREKIAKVYKVEADNIICGNGSEELLHLIPRVLLGADDSVILPTYTFKGIKIGVLACGARPVYIPQSESNQYAYTADDILKLINDSVKMIFLDHPGNPVSSFLSEEEVLTVLRAAHSKGIYVVLDGAYAEYAQFTKGYALNHNWVQSFPNTIIIRTFSKAYGLPGLRLGWMYAHSDIIKRIHKIRLPYHINTLAQKAGLCALEDQKHLASCIERSIKIRQDLLNFLSSYAPWPSATNFVIVSTKFKNADWCADYFKSHKILLKSLSDYGLPQYLKISVGKESDMQ